MWPCLSAIVPRLVLSTFNLCQPFLVQAAVSHMGIQVEESNEDYGKALVGAFVLVYVGIAVSRAVYWRQSYRMISRIRSGLISMLYRHTASLSAVAVSDSAALTLMGTDVERIVQSLRLAHELWASILEVGIASWLLGRQVGVASIVPLIICIASVAATSKVSARFGLAQRHWIERVQKRVSVTAGMLGDMKTVKMLGLSMVYENTISYLRKVELNTSEKFRTLLVWQMVISTAPAIIAPFATLAVYAIIAVAKKDDTLLASHAFASMSLISLITYSLNVLCTALPSLMQGVACFTRIEKYLLRKRLFMPLFLPSPPSESSEHSMQLGKISSNSPEAAIITLKGADICWSGDSPDIILHKLNLNIRPGFTAIVGSVASGKSTLLATILGETALRSGSMTPSLSGVAFCSQTPWIMNDTIRHNITGGSEFDQEWYKFCVSCCALREDIDKMPAGDQSIAGSNGAALSGGQKQRVCIARAMYSRLPIVILDDVLSGLDASTTNRISDQLFGRDGHFRRSGTSVILATHSRRILSFMDLVVVLEGGRITNCGPYCEEKGQESHVFGLKEACFQPEAQSVNERRDTAGHSDSETIPDPSCPGIIISPQLNLQRQTGNWSVYKYYSRTAGRWALIIWVLFTISEAVFANFAPVWVDIWTKSNEKSPNQQTGLYIGIYATLVVLTNAAIAGEAPLSFFHTTDTGTMTNRFSQDMDLIDMTLPSQAMQLMTGATSCLVQLVIICVLGKYFAAALPILALVLFLVQRYYLRTSRQVRLLDIEAKAPIFKHFIETIHGVVTIRAFRWNSKFHENFSEVLDVSQRPFYMLFCIQQWLVLVLDLIVGAMAVIIVAVAVSTVGSLEAGALGVTLVLIVEFNLLLAQSTQAWTRLETSIGAVARVQSFIHETPSEPIGIKVLPKIWPSRGSIQFQNVVANYKCDDPPALVNVSLTIDSGEKIAICGSSGSGKTTAVLALLQMIEVGGGLIKIDDQDIANLDGNDLRSRINVVPQDPFFIPGSIKYNLDPRGLSSDSSIEIAIRKVGLWMRVGAIGGIEVEMMASEWSHGEKQLLCLARALLVPSKVLILDEATSSVDETTEGIMQGVIDTEFQDQTIISVLHRFKHIKQFDRVAVFSQGSLVECDAPLTLLEKDSALRELYRAQNPSVSVKRTESSK
ncbi:hypothetical protein N7501_000009 [Penicillium viridicatum]|nr:hypothetical protein N7501_000009 [Penicillium viridicatum]